jgi:RNA polymerase sigma-70 factor (ECF subfamily)
MAQRTDDAGTRFSRAKAAVDGEPGIRFTAKERDFVYGVAMRYMKDEEDANDVAQDALLLAYRHLDSFQGNSRFTTWLYRIAATTALMHLRKRRRTPLMVSVDAPEGEESRDEARGAVAGAVRGGDASPEDASASSEALSIAAGELSRMGEKYGRIFSMRFLEGFSEAEIARRLHLNVSTVKTRAYRARAHLRRHLAKQLGEPETARPHERAEAYPVKLAA